MEKERERERDGKRAKKRIPPASEIYAKKLNKSISK